MVISEVIRDAPWARANSKPLNSKENGGLILHSTKLNTGVLQLSSEMSFCYHSAALFLRRSSFCKWNMTTQHNSQHSTQQRPLLIEQTVLFCHSSNAVTYDWLRRHTRTEPHIWSSRNFWCGKNELHFFEQLHESVPRDSHVKISNLPPGIKMSTAWYNKQLEVKFYMVHSLSFEGLHTLKSWLHTCSFTVCESDKQQRQHPPLVTFPWPDRLGPFYPEPYNSLLWD